MTTTDTDTVASTVKPGPPLLSVATLTLARRRAVATLAVSSARRVGDPTRLALALAALADARAAQAYARGTPPHLVHRDGWDLTTPEARAYYT